MREEGSEGEKEGGMKLSQATPPFRAAEGEGQEAAAPHGPGTGS